MEVGVAWFLKTPYGVYQIYSAAAQWNKGTAHRTAGQAHQELPNHMSRGRE